MSGSKVFPGCGCQWHGQTDLRTPGAARTAVPTETPPSGGGLPLGMALEH